MHECTHPQEWKKPGTKPSDTNAPRKRKHESRRDLGDEGHASKGPAAARPDLECLEEGSALPKTLEIEPDFSSSRIDPALQRAETIRNLSFIIHRMPIRPSIVRLPC